ncbi:MAG: NADH-quinone oxidoreductase subunit NuoH [Candidatus Hodarchaeales archaeon]|jgi:NADH-quinone oxidoreductase subunit H
MKIIEPLYDDLLDALLPSEYHQVATFLTQALLMFGLVSLDIILIIWLERKLMGHFMHRRGPGVDPMWPVIGKIGLMQNIADFVKFLGKEDLVPDDADRSLFDYSIFLIILTAIIGLAVIPFTQEWFITSPAAGLLYITAVLSIYPVAVLVGGWASNNKYSIIGGFRAAAQLISYEIPLVLAIAGVIMWTGSFGLGDIVQAQKEQGLWFMLLMPIGLIVFMVAMAAESERIPFDLPEAEAELVMGWRTEYASWRYMFAMFHEYAGLFISSVLVVILFLGGWEGPFADDTAFGNPIQLFWFALKLHLVVFVMIWLRAALPRVRIDQLLDIGWKRLIPLALLNIVWIAVLLIVNPFGIVK